MKEELESAILQERRQLDRSRMDIEQIHLKDKNSKQLYLELKGLQEKLSSIMNKNIESEEGMLVEAKNFRAKIELDFQAN